MNHRNLKIAALVAVSAIGINCQNGICAEKNTSPKTSKAVKPASKEDQLIEQLRLIFTDVEARYSAVHFDASIEDYAKLLNHADPEVRLGAAYMLVSERDERGIDVLINGLSETDIKLRRFSAGSLDNVDDPRVTAKMIDLLKDDDEEVRATAVALLGKTNDPKVLPLIRNAVLNDKSANVRCTAVAALENNHTPETLEVLLKAIKSDGSEVVGTIYQDLDYSTYPASSIPILEKYMTDRNSEVKEAAIKCLVRIEDPKADELLLPLLKDRNLESSYDIFNHFHLSDNMSAKQIDAFIKSRKETPVAKEAYHRTQYVPKLQNPNATVESLKSKDKQIVDSAYKQLIAVKDTATVEPLIKLLKSTDKTIQFNAIVVLGHISDPRAIDPVAKTMNQGGPNTVVAARALQRMKKPEIVVEPMIKLLSDKSLKAKKEAMVVLVDSKDNRAIKPLAAKLNDDKLYMNAAWALAKIGGPEAINAIKLQVKFPSTTLKAQQRQKTITFIRTLGLIGDESAVDTIEPGLKSKDQELKEASAIALAKIGGDKATDALIAEIKNPKITDKYEFIEFLDNAGAQEAVIGALSSIAQGSNPNANAKIAKTTEFYIDALKKPFVNDWAEAAKAIGNAKVTGAADILAQRMNRCPEAAIALGKLGDNRAYEPVVALLESHYSIRESEIISSLGELSDPRALDIIIGLIGNQEYIDDDAIAALGRRKDPKAIEPLMSILADFRYSYPDVTLTQLEPMEGQIDDWLRSGCNENDNFAVIFSTLRSITQKDFGNDSLKWLTWWESEVKENMKTQGVK